MGTRGSSNGRPGQCKIRGSFDALAVAELRNLLRKKAPTQEAEDAALEAILDAVEDYLQARPLVDDDGRRHAITSSSETREALSRLVKHLNAAKSTLAEFPIGATVDLNRTLDRHALRFKAGLHQLADAANAALSAARAQDDKTTDTARFVLAYEVARVFRDVLGIRPTKSRPTNPTVTGSKGGALYGRVLQQSMRLAGRGSVNVDPMIDRGIAMLRDPDLP